MDNEKKVDEVIEEDAAVPEEEAEKADSAEETEEAGLSAKVLELEAEIDKARNDYIRLFAEYDNYRKRTAKEKAETYSNASVKCIENLLPVVDSFERSLECECTDENFKNGMTMIFNQMKDFLSGMNVTEIDALGAEFDPKYHNAIQQIADSECESNHVCAVYQKGYMLGDKLIRPAMVAVAQ